MAIPQRADIANMSVDEQKQALKKMAYEGLFDMLSDKELRIRFPNVYLRAVEVSMDRSEGTAPTKVQHSFEDAPWLGVVRSAGRTVDGRKFDDVIETTATPVDGPIEAEEETVIIWGTAS